jgi:hypothetical protein
VIVMRATLSIEAAVAALGGLSRDDLAERWCKAYGLPPPKGIRQDLLLRAAAWHLQVKHLGGYSAEMRRLLRSAMDQAEAKLLNRSKRKSNDAAALGDAEAHGSGFSCTDHLVNACTTYQRAETERTKLGRRRRRVLPGARLVREWNGKTYVVDIIEGGYVFEAKVYQSLTAIAGKITGVHWSGPRFFGL